MTKLDLGALGVSLDPSDADVLRTTAAEAERLGYSTIWLSGGRLQHLDQVVDTVRATDHIRVATGIIAVDRFDAEAVLAAYAECETLGSGRFVVGVGGAHGAKPFTTLGGYLDRLDAGEPAVPKSARILAALGPRMLDLAADRTAGAYPVLVTPDYTADARARIGDRANLAVQQLVVLDTDARRARDAAREPLGFLSQQNGYAANFRRMGFTDDDIDSLSDRLVDALTSWGEADAIAARVAEHHQAGADHVSLTLLSTEGTPTDPWRLLAEALPVSPPS